MQRDKRSAGWKWAVTILSACVLTGSLRAGHPQVKAGVASRIITPKEPMWMAGYGNRNKPAEGKLQNLYVKALALEDQAGGQLVLDGGG